MNISYPTPVGLWVTMCIHCCLAQAYSGTAIQTVTDYLSVSEWTVKEIASHLRGVTLADYLVPDECTSLSVVARAWLATLTTSELTEVTQYTLGVSESESLDKDYRFDSRPIWTIPVSTAYLQIYDKN